MTWHIHIKGQVQGMGFRPYIYRTAQINNLNGWVNNSSDGVHIVFNADEKLAISFKDLITQNAPDRSVITAIHLQKTKDEIFNNFQIIHSQKQGEPNLLITPDIALCQACRKELYTTLERRFHYPFITCTNCGPRFSIIHQLPYDRENTKMDSFRMCMNCKDEYENPVDRRYYAQTNSCPTCSIELSLYKRKESKLSIDPENIIDLVIRFWNEGDIVAIKGIGGYILTCDASNKKAVSELRRRKHRPSKPFALMYPNFDSLSDYQLTEQSTQELQSSVSPIVLLDVNSKPSFSEIAPRLNKFGVMLPYTPLYELLMNRFGKPIVATSGNLSNSPIIFQDRKALEDLAQIADYVLVNNRQIVIPQDDSVVKFTFWENQKIILRRSRGLAPTYINDTLKLPAKSILATGANLKSTFSFLHKENIFISPYLGDLESFETQQNYEHTVRYFLKLFKSEPEVILSDSHLDYASTNYGRSISKDLNIPIHSIQHHTAHFGAVIGENNLIHTKESLLGIIWDGTGLGEDGQIWGGEFFKYDQYKFERCCHFNYFDHILGDKMAKEPRLSALSSCWDIVGVEEILKEKFTKTEWNVYTKILDQRPTLKTSSVGRIFDAVSALLGIVDKQSYEGEAAMQLENLATLYFKKHGIEFSESYPMELVNNNRISTKKLMTNIVIDLQNGKPKDYIAAKFHYSLIGVIQSVANILKVKLIAFSGGVFQNGLLVDLIQYNLKYDYNLYFHDQLSPNDENISFGQLICYQIAQLKKSQKLK